MNEMEVRNEGFSGASLHVQKKDHREERIIMMDILMIAVLLGCFGLVKLFADFCESQVNPKEK